MHESAIQSDDNPGQTFADYTKLLGVAINSCTELARSIHFDKTHQWHVGLLTLYGTILELSHSIFILTKNDSPIGIPILLRTLLEAAVDFNNLAKDRMYGYNMDAANASQWILILKEAKSNSNPYLADIAAIPDLNTILQQHQQELDKLKSKGYKALKHSEKFEISDMSLEYKSFYNFLCCETHNNLRALHSRHAKISPDHLDYEMEYFSPIDPVANLQYLDSTAGILLSVTESIHEKLESGLADQINPLTEQLNSLREPWRA